VPCLLRGLRCWWYGRTVMSLAVRSLSSYGLWFPLVPLITTFLYAYQLLTFLSHILIASPLISLW
jgi:hypothetical protein